MNLQVTNVDPWLPHRSRSEEPSLIVLHATGGSNVSGAIDTLRERGLSYSFIIGKDGHIYKCVPNSAVAWHAGNSFGPREEAGGVSREQDSADNFTAHPVPCVNSYSFGIAFVNMDDPENPDPYTQEQVIAASWLVLELKKAFPSIKWISTHAIVSPRRKIDPYAFDAVHFCHGVGLPLWRPA